MPIHLRPLALSLAMVFQVSAQGLDKEEKKLVTYIESHLDQQLAALETVVNIDSGTFNAAGVKAVGAYFRKELEALGFTTRWIDMPEAMHRGGHLVAERVSATGNGKRVLLLGHLDTIFEGDGHRFKREGDKLWGAGSADMKGGDLVILYALKALHAAGAMDGATVRVFLTGDEESPGLPTHLARQDLVAVARLSDVVLSFESFAGDVVIGRRGITTWTLQVGGVQGHSAGVLKKEVGAGAIYEAVRILDAVRISYMGHPTLTINPGLFLGGTTVGYDPVQSRGSSAGKFNVVPKAVTVVGDLRFLTNEERDQAKARMNELAAANLPKTSAHFEFEDAFPGWPAADPNPELLVQASQVNQDLGLGPLPASDPVSRGGGDASFIALIIPALDGLGVGGVGAHGPQEYAHLGSVAPSTSRAAVLISRLLKQAR